MIKKKHTYQFDISIGGQYHFFLYHALKFSMPRLSANQIDKIKIIVRAVINEVNADLLEIKFIKKELKVNVKASQTSIFNEDVLNSKIQHAIDNFLYMNQLHPKFDDTNFVHNKIIRLNRFVSLTAQTTDGEVFGIPLDYNKTITFKKIEILPREIKDENIFKLLSTPFILVERFSFHVKSNGEHQLDLFLPSKREVTSAIKNINKNTEITFYTPMGRILTISYTI